MELESTPDSSEWERLNHAAERASEWLHQFERDGFESEQQRDESLRAFESLCSCISEHNADQLDACAAALYESIGACPATEAKKRGVHPEFNERVGRPARLSLSITRGPTFYRDFE